MEGFGELWWVFLSVTMALTTMAIVDFKRALAGKKGVNHECPPVVFMDGILWLVGAGLTGVMTFVSVLIKLL